MSTRSTAIYLCPQFPVIALVGYTSVLSVANKHADQRIYTWSLHSQSGQPVTASNGSIFEVTGGLDDDVAATNVFVIAGYDTHKYQSRKLSHWLHHLNAKGANIGAIDAGQFLVAEARLVDGPICIHPEARSAFSELYPEIEVQRRGHILGPRRSWCAGGLATIEMALEMVERDHGERLRIKVSEDLMAPSSWSSSACSPDPGPPAPDAVDQIARNFVSDLEETETVKDFASRCGFSRRKLERQFRSKLGVSPAAFKRFKRLEKAKELVTQTDLPIMSIAMSCGFSSAAALARAYREEFGISATSDRSRDKGSRLLRFYGIDNEVEIGLPSANGETNRPLLCAHRDPPRFGPRTNRYE